MKKFLIIAAAAILTAGCSHTQYIPIESVRTEYQNHTDTVLIKDSVHTETNTVIREADSALVAQLGLKLKDNERAILILRNELQRIVNEKQEHSTDTVIERDTIQVTVPVERQLTRWESFCLDYGKLTLGGSVIALLFIVLWIVRWVRLRQR